MLNWPADSVPCFLCCPETSFQSSFRIIAIPGHLPHPTFPTDPVGTSVKLWTFQICRVWITGAKATLLTSNKFSSFSSPLHPFREFLVTLFSRRKLWRVLITIPKYISIAGIFHGGATLSGCFLRTDQMVTVWLLQAQDRQPELPWLHGYCNSHVPRK